MIWWREHIKNKNKIHPDFVIDHPVLGILIELFLRINVDPVGSQLFPDLQRTNMIGYIWLKRIHKFDNIISAFNWQSVTWMHISSLRMDEENSSKRMSGTPSAALVSIIYSLCLSEWLLTSTITSLKICYLLLDQTAETQQQNTLSLCLRNSHSWRLWRTMFDFQNE